MKKQTNTQTENMAIEEVAVPLSSLTKDLKSSVLIVSVLANLGIFVAWVAIQVTSRYDDQLVSFLFNR